MTLSRAKEMIESYEGNTWLIHRFVDGVTDDDSLLQLPFEANCMNWILGHIVARRNSSLACLDVPSIWPAGVAETYVTGSPPLQNGADARSFSLLVDDLDKAQAALEHALSQADDQALDAIVENDRGTKSAIEHIQGFHWHETYHIGQLEILRSFIETRETGHAGE